MTRTSHSIRLVLILATVIGIHGLEKTPREATLTIQNDFEDGQTNREFKVDYAGFSGSEIPIIRIFKDGETSPKVEYPVEKEAGKAQILYFKLKDAPAGSYHVAVCLPSGPCSEKRAAVGEILEKTNIPTLSCLKGKGKEEDVFHTFLNEKNADKFTIPISAGEAFITDAQFKATMDVAGTGYNLLKPKSNPGYVDYQGERVFYAAVWYNGKPLKELFENWILPKKGAVRVHGYCSRKYVFWASAQIVDQTTKVVRRRFRGTIIVTKDLATRFMKDESAPSFPVEFARFDEESDQLKAGTYDVSVSFCATDKDVVNSSVCSTALYSELVIP